MKEEGRRERQSKVKKAADGHSCLEGNHAEEIEF